MGRRGVVRAQVLVTYGALAAVLLMIVSGTRPALAQSCHMPALRPADAAHFRVAAQAAFASYKTSGYVGEYQGYFATASWTHPWLAAEASIGGYRLVRNGLTERGLGDLMLDLRGTLYRFDDELAVGAELALSLPTGDATRGLGMGHAMLMPAAWLGLQRGPIRLFVQVGYGRVVQRGHQHGSATGPLVSPMNRSEIEHAVTFSYVFRPPLFVGARLVGAVPVADVRGTAREVGALGLGASLAGCELTLELQGPLVGSPFEAKILLQVAAVF